MGPRDRYRISSRSPNIPSNFATAADDGLVDSVGLPTFLVSGEQGEYLALAL
jgi:hypothetical protein